jgi:hypothetical protein
MDDDDIEDEEEDVDEELDRGEIISSIKLIVLN